MRGSREISLVPSLRRASTDALIRHADNAPLGPYARVHAHVMASFSECLPAHEEPHDLP